MARAKRTDRAEARRRHRARLDELAAESAAGSSAGDAAPATARPVRGAGQSSSGQSTTGRPASGPTPGGIAYAFRAAFRPVRLNEDLALLPQLIRSRAVWIPVLITVVTTAIWLVTGGRDLISRILIDYFVVTPPIGAIFIAGFLATRASYLTGAIAGLAGAICLSVIVLTSPTGAAPTAGAPGVAPSGSPIASAAPASPATSGAPSADTSSQPSAAASEAPSASPEASPTPSGTPAPPPTPEQIGQLIGAAFVISPLTGVFFGSAAAWYKRFLNLANPNRGQRRQQANRNRSNRRR